MRYHYLRFHINIQKFIDMNRHILTSVLYDKIEHNISRRVREMEMNLLDSRRNCVNNSPSLVKKLGLLYTSIM